jgi:hypothetical protein
MCPRVTFLAQLQPLMTMIVVLFSGSRACNTAGHKVRQLNDGISLHIHYHRVLGNASRR